MLGAGCGSGSTGGPGGGMGEAGDGSGGADSSDGGTQATGGSSAGKGGSSAGKGGSSAGDGGSAEVDGGSGGSEQEPEPCSDGRWDHDEDARTECVAWTDCAPGEFVATEGSATADRTCSGCESGSFSTVANAAACTEWTACVAGEHVSTKGSATTDRACEACAPGTYTSGDNQTACVPEGECAPGTQQTAAGTATTPVTCEACATGSYCAGAKAAPQPCADNTWDDDTDPATECVTKKACIAGQYVEDAGTATTNRSCTDCESGTYSTTENADSCATWTDCGAYVVATAGTRSEDQTCGDECLAGYIDVGGCRRPANCTELHKADAALSSGDYVIDPDGAGGNPELTASCDMATDDGGWTLVLNYHHQGGTNPELEVRSSDLPLRGTALLGDDDSATASWGHASRAMMAQLNASELRFYGRTSAHDRVMHFATRNANCLSYFAGGSGDCRGLAADYRALAGHDTNAPGVGADGFTEQGDAAMTEFPFYQNSAYHWGIRGFGGRWEVDDFANSADSDTVHQIWVRHSRPANCAAILAEKPSATSGVYTIDPDGELSTPPIEAHCDMVTDGGGWTLVLKADGDQNTFAYTAPLWTNQALLNANSPDFDTTEAKLDTFNSTPFTELLIRMQVPLTSGDVRSLRISHAADSLHAVMTTDTYTPFTTPPTRDDWKALAGPTASLQYNCNRQGFNVQPGYSSIRIGFLGNNEDDCGSPDSYIGVGGQDSPCVGGHAPTVGGSAGCGGDNGDYHYPGFAWVYVR